jgi:hypothetical protein
VDRVEDHAWHAGCDWAAAPLLGREEGRGTNNASTIPAAGYHADLQAS